MTGASLIDMAVTFLDDTATPSLWARTELLSYLNEGYKKFCQETKILVDSSTTAVCQISVTAGNALLSVSPLVTELISVRFVGVDGVTYMMDKYYLDELDEYWYSWRTQTSKGPTGYLFDSEQETSKMRIIPYTTQNGTIYMTVARLPLTDLTDSTGSTPEIRSDYHADLVDYILHRAYLKNDSETYDKKKSDEHLALFMSKIERAKVHRIHRRHGFRSAYYGEGVF